MTAAFFNAVMWAAIGGLLATTAWTIWHRRHLRRLDRAWGDIERAYTRLARENDDLNRAWTELGEAVARHHAIHSEWNV